MFSANLSLYNKFLKKQSFWNVVSYLSPFVPNFVFKQKPKEIIVELTNACNLRCPVCPTHFAMKREKDFMKFNTFKLILKDFLHQKNKPLISFSFAGEPLLHPNSPLFVKYAASKGFPTYISTNATLLNKDVSEKLITSGLTKIHLALDGFSKKSHEAYRIGSNFEKVKKNIETFIRIKEKIGSNKPYVVIQTLITSFSECEIDKLITWAREIGANEVYFKSFSMGSYTTQAMKKKYSYFLPKNKKYRRDYSKITKTVCLSPITQALVFWDGSLGLCCIDFDNISNMPKITEFGGFMKTFTSKKAIGVRKLAFRKKLELCKKCDIGSTLYYGFKVKIK